MNTPRIWYQFSIAILYKKQIPDITEKNFAQEFLSQEFDTK